MLNFILIWVQLLQIDQTEKTFPPKQQVVCASF